MDRGSVGTPCSLVQTGMENCPGLPENVEMRHMRDDRGPVIGMMGISKIEGASLGPLSSELAPIVPGR